jgi:predicted nucleic acid-binding protein
MIVVADTSPLNYLIQIEHDSLLQALFKRVIVPEVVLAELSHAGAPQIVRGWAQHPPQWIEPRRPAASDDPYLRILDPGEREAILLAEELTADLLLIDEKRGRVEAARRGLPTTGTLGVLLLAARQKLIDPPHVYSRLVSETSFRSTPQLEETFLKLTARPLDNQA